jgi:ketosteroid isomerase-like protein
MSKDNIETIRQVYAVFDRRDYEAVLAIFDPKLVWIAAENSPLADRSPYRGVDEIREGVFARIAAGYQKLEVQIDEIFATDEKVVVLGYYDGIRKADGNSSHTQLAHMWTMVNNQPVQFQQYLDTYKVAESFKSAAVSGARG